jgi:hypothetical protein
VKRATIVQLIAYGLALLTTGLALLVWLPSTASGITSYVLFPVFGLVAFGLMWGHYVMGVVRRMFGVDKGALGAYWLVTSWVTLFCILAHPFLVDLQLYIDGLGLPPDSLFTVYVRPLDRVALFAGFTALLSFLSYELYRFFQRKSWWKYVEWLNIVAMCLILFHGFVLGGELRSPWFQVIWIGYALTFAASVAYTGYYERRKNYAGKSIF